MLFYVYFNSKKGIYKWSLTEYKNEIKQSIYEIYNVLIHVAIVFAIDNGGYSL